MATTSARPCRGRLASPRSHRVARWWSRPPPLGSRPTRAGLSDLGAHRLDGFERSEHPCCVSVYPDVPIDDRPLRRATPPSATFPARGAPLIGRAGDLAVLEALLRHHRLVTVVGPGGVGKTRVALAAATAASSQFPTAPGLSSWRRGRPRPRRARSRGRHPRRGAAASTTPRALATALGVQRPPHRDSTTASTSHSGWTTSSRPSSSPARTSRCWPRAASRWAARASRCSPFHHWP